MATSTTGRQTQTRERSSGRYSYDGQWDRVCARCGLTLGQHTAEAPHIVDDMIEGVQRECKGFRPTK